MVRVAVIGHGLIGRQRAAAIAALAGEPGATCALAATVDPAPRAADLYGATPHFARLEDCPPSSYDAAVIAVPHDLASPLARAALAQGKPVLVEKPLGLDGAEARALAAAASGTHSFVGYNYRYLPTMREAFGRIARGELGALRAVDVFLGHGGHPGSAEGWKLRPERAGGGVILDPGVHLFDLLLCLEPRLALRHVTATRGFWKTGIEEDVVVVMSHGDLMATVRVSHIRWVNTFRIEIGGDGGYVHIDGRGGSYGPQVARFGRRWAWNDGRGHTQRESEETNDFGLANRSLDVETAEVIRRWSMPGVAADQIGNAASEAGPGPATFADGVRIAELCDQMYAAIGSVSSQ
jgi:1,5-anhydro-D-fructose reductase (1,5-anhydro-D-mannitol-forming)